ncbi:LysM peptidoglycan-binding domain-containing protein [Calothrix sp. FACHB-1219]|uniref:LysM peptidoglycan-binding domain-containing protein n=1 Tax=unclassified Calothrix TaxID=2619626 RepID=UPI0016880222|nr:MULTISPECIES: LysM domain-containing protein [unclassified Calothrix]MBD2204732.1 LysM peptidoglycan-binding domain-containing protein [Calothrix sp. FACHB-168]MBD2218120.1 LysM peptidoglycan-binding domain-containing protein [Calothrix sp. FACHB-1219]
MKTILNCPVCGYQEVTSYTCPNCDTDLSVIRILQELPAVKTTVSAAKFHALPLAIALLTLLLGICLGFGSRFIFPTTQLHALTVPSPHPIVNSRVSLNPPFNQPPVVMNTITYTVQSGDHLSAIAEKFCGRGTPWEIMVTANPQLQNRENHINIGEELNIPKCKESKVNGQ